jgi:acetyl-CoA carboxylase carboxyltransferase component
MATAATSCNSGAASCGRRQRRVGRVDLASTALKARSSREGPQVLAPKERLLCLCDPGSFEPIRSAVAPNLPLGSTRRGDGVVAGVGMIEGRKVACYAQDPSHVAGTLGRAHADTIDRLLEIAGRMRLPVISFIESGGARLQEGTSALAGYARVFRRTVSLSKTVPQISVVAGLSAGGGCYSPALTDFIVMTERAAMFLTGPQIVEQATGEMVSAEELGGPRLHARNGVCDFVVDGDRSAALLARRLLGYLPQHVGVPAPFVAGRDQEGADPAATVPSCPRRVYDVRELLATLADPDSPLEVGARWARNMVTSFARFEGRPVGVIANQPRYIGGVIDAEAAQKGARFVNQCDAFGLPLVVLVDTPGFMPGRKQEEAGVIRFGASLVRAFASATVPKLTVVVRKAFGGAYIAMNSKDLGADFVFAWPGAEIGIMSAHAAVGITKRRELLSAGDRGLAQEAFASAYRDEFLEADAAAAGGFVDEVIDPSETRRRIASALDLHLTRGPNSGVPG